MDASTVSPGFRVSKHKDTGPGEGFLTFRMRVVQLVLGVGQPTKVRRLLLWSIETEHKGSTMIMTVKMKMMKMKMKMMMTMMRKYCPHQGFVCRSTMMMMIMMMMACPMFYQLNPT